MTFREKLCQEHPESIGAQFMGGCEGCPNMYGYEERSGCPEDPCGECGECRECWDREIGA